MSPFWADLITRIGACVSVTAVVCLATFGPAYYYLQGVAS